MVACLLFIQGATLFAQHPPMFSQYMFNPLVINPAYTGSRDALSVTALYRHQWAGMVGAPRTQTLTAHSPLKRESSSLGLSFVHDRLAVSQHTMIYGSYAYRIDMGPKAGRLAFGLQGGISLLTDKWTEVVTDQPNDLVFGSDSPTYLVPRVGFGMYWDHRRWYLGFSTPYLVEYKNPAFSQYVQNSISYRPWMFMAGCVVRLNPDWMLKPSTLVKILSPSSYQLDANLNLVYKEMLWFGGSYRTQDGIVAMVEFQANPQFRFGYAFDYGLTPLQKYHHGSHELMLRYEFSYKLKTQSPRYF